MIFARRRAVFVFWFGLSLLRPVLALYSSRFILALLSLSSILSFFRRENAKINGSGQVEQAKEDARGRQSKQLPTKHQIAEDARGRKQERDHPDLPQTVDFVVLDAIF